MVYIIQALTRARKYRGVEQLVARRAHNPEVVWFKSHPRNQKIPFALANGIFLSKPQAWYIITPQGVYIIKVGKPTLYLITRQRAFPAA